ncbi:MAG: septum formation initiator family protein [Candidatus Gastranaerophilales bacterium]
MQEDNNINENINSSKNSILKRTKKRAKINKRKTRFYYSFLTITLLFCLIQIGFGVILNISKTIAHQAKISTLKKIKVNAEEYNKDLKQEIDKFSSTETLEGIARNNLKMAGEDEILILINNKTEDEIIEQKNLVQDFLEKFSGE